MQMKSGVHFSCYCCRLAESNVKPEQVVGIGITNQRETTVIWERKQDSQFIMRLSGNPDKRQICEELKAKGYDQLFREKTGLLIDAYFSGTKVKWI